MTTCPPLPPFQCWRQMYREDHHQQQRHEQRLRLCWQQFGLHNIEMGGRGVEEILVTAAHDTWSKTCEKLTQHWNGGRGCWGEFVVVAKNGTSSATFKLLAQNTLSRLFIPGMDSDFGSYGTSSATFKLSAQNTLSRLFIPGMDSDFGSFDFVNLSHSS